MVYQKLLSVMLDSNLRIKLLPRNILLSVSYIYNYFEISGSYLHEIMKYLYIYLLRLFFVLSQDPLGCRPHKSNQALLELLDPLVVEKVVMNDDSSAYELYLNRSFFVFQLAYLFIN